MAGLLISLADGLAGELRPGGTLVGSGIFVDREDEVRRSRAGAGLLPVSRRAEGDWVALRLTAPG